MEEFVLLIWMKVWLPYKIKLNVWRISNMFLPLYPCILGNLEIHEHQQHPDNENKLTIEKNFVRIFRLFKTKPHTIPRRRTQSQLNYPFNHTVDLPSHKRHQTNKPLKIEDGKKETQETQQLFKLPEVVVSIWRVLMAQEIRWRTVKILGVLRPGDFLNWDIPYIEPPKHLPFVFIYLFIHL